MTKKHNTKAKASAGLMRNNKKGLTLVELVAAIAILGVIILPVMHAFTTAFNLESKSRKIGEATDIAHNVQEVINSMSVDEFLAGSKSRDLLECDAVAKGTDVTTGYNYASIRGLRAGNSNYNAKVTFGTGEGEPEYDMFGNIKKDSNGNVIFAEGTDNFYKLNYDEIVDYCVPDGTFSQPYTKESNPDIIADTYFRTANNYKDYITKDRKITVDIYGEYKDEATNPGLEKVFMTVRYTYTYKYYTGELGHAVTDTYTKEIEYSVMSTGAEPHEDGTPLNFYIMYYPVYYTESMRPAKYRNPDMPVTVHDNIIINNNRDGKMIPTKIFLVKQWPVEMTETTEADGTTKIDYQKAETEQLKLLENDYNCSIKEYFPSNYNVGTDAEKYLYTNAVINQADGMNTELAGVSYNLIGSTEDIRLGQVRDGNVIRKGQENRIFDLTIEVTEGDKTIAVFKGSKMR